jgi:NAD-dependent dihydropyrimidine dehydrogenase PreA subunit/flavodoxin
MALYKKLILFYFSGTGNAKKVAEWIGQSSVKENIPFEIINIENLKIKAIPEIHPDTLIGFCSPTHGFNFPAIMMNFIIRFPGNKKASVFIVNTRAGMKLYKVFLPGLSGLAQILTALVLKIKGYKVVGMQPMDLPSNWISLHPGLRQKVIDSIFGRCKKITQNFSNRILNGGRKYQALWSLPFDLAIIPIAILYYLAGRFALSKTFVAGPKCDQCGLCIKQCPVNAIKMIADRPFWTFDCESCMHCMNHCPQRAIETAFGFTFLIWWAIISFIPNWILWVFRKEFFSRINQSVFLSELLYNFLLICAALIIIYVAYYLLHFLMRFKWFNKIVIFTSLTRFNWWRRYKAPKHF